MLIKFRKSRFRSLNRGDSLRERRKEGLEDTSEALEGHDAGGVPLFSRTVSTEVNHHLNSLAFGLA